MQEGSSSMVKGDSASGDKEERPTVKKYGILPDDGNGHWKGVNVSYQIEIMPDRNGRLKF